MLCNKFSLTVVTVLVTASLSVSLLSSDFAVLLSNANRLEKLIKKLLGDGGVIKKPFIDGIFELALMPKVDGPSFKRLGQLVGFFLAWPIGDHVGRKRGLVISNIFRSIAVFFHFCGLVIWIIMTMTMSSEDKEDEAEKDIQLYATTATSCTADFDNNSTLNFTSLEKREIFLRGFSYASLFTEGIHCGLSSILGIIYVFEIVSLPHHRSSSSSAHVATTVWTVPVVAMHLFLTLLINHSLTCALPSLVYSPEESVNFVAWCIVGGLSLGMGLVQVVLLLTCCPDNYSVVEMQREKMQKDFRQLVRTNESFNQSTGSSQVLEPLGRSSCLVMLQAFFLLFYATCVASGVVNGYILGMTIWTMINEYLLFYIFSVLLALPFYGLLCYLLNGLGVHVLKRMLMYSYALLGLLFAVTFSCTVNQFMGAPTRLTAVIIVVLVCISTTIYFSGASLITTVLILEYPQQAVRAKNVVLSFIFGLVLSVLVFVCFFNIFAIAVSIFKTSFFLFYLLALCHLLVLALICYLVWKCEVGWDRMERGGGGGEGIAGDEAEDDDDDAKINMLDNSYGFLLCARVMIKNTE